MKAIGFLGGTFDPVHNGHLKLAKEVLKKLPLSQIQFIPSNDPPHREKPLASAIDRLNMLKIALENEPYLTVNEIEIQRTGYSYSIDTLRKLRETFPNESLCFILSTDAFVHFNKWHESSKILDYCHLIITNRPAFHFIKTDWINDFEKTHGTTEPQDLINHKAGKIYFLTVPTIDIRATDIRENLKRGQLPTDQIPKAELAYIQLHHLYH